MAFPVPRHPTRVFALLLGISGCLTEVACSAVEMDGLPDHGDEGTGNGPEGDGGGDAADEGDDGAGDEETGGGEGEGGDADDDGDDPGPAPDDGIDPGSVGTCSPDAESEFAITSRQIGAMASPVHVREAVLAGSHDLKSVSIRTQEFFNYYEWNYPQPSHDQRIRLHVDMHQPDETAPDEYVLQIGVTTEEASRRPDLNLTLVIENSPQLTGKPFERLKEVCRALAASLREGDRVSIVGWNGQALLSGHEVAEPNAATLLATIESAEIGAEGTLSQALEGGYDMAKASFSTGRANRIVLISDGDETESVADIDLIEEAVNLEQDGGIQLVGVGVGFPEHYDSGLMERLAHSGRGSSVFVGSAEEAWTIFNDRFMNTLFAAVRDVELVVRLPDGFELIPFDEDNPMPVNSAPQDVGPADSLVVMHRVRTCAPAPVEGQIAVEVDYDGAYIPQSVTASIPDLLQNPSAELTKGLLLLSLDAFLKAQKEGSLSDALIQQTFARLELAESRLPEDNDLADIRAIVEALSS